MQEDERPIDQTAQRQILTRLTELESRVEFLEDVVVAEPEPASFESVHAPAFVPPSPAASEVDSSADQAADSNTAFETAVERDPADLRTLQREATADLDDTWNAEAQPAQEPGRSIDLADLEERLTGRALALVGGAALILGAVFFLSLAFSRGWIGPSLQVTLGLAAGTMGLLIGGLLLVRGDRTVGHVLTAVGLAVVSLSFFAATSLYGLIPVPLGLIGALIAAGITTVIAIASRSQVVAGFGLIAVLAAPSFMGAEPDFLTLAFMATALIGVAVISLWQTWSWLPPLAFLLSAPQLYLWIQSEPELLLGAIALLLYWALMAIAAGGESFRSQRSELSLSSSPLLMAAGAFVVLLGFDLLPSVDQQVAFLLVLAAAHGAIALFFFSRRGEVDPFGLLAGAYGIAIASLAVPLYFGASLTAVVWSAEAAALAVVAGRRAHAPSLIAALTLLGVAALRLAMQALDLASSGQPLTAVVGPFDVLEIGLAALVVAAVVFIAAVPNRTVRTTVASIAFLACLPVVYYEFSGLAMVIAATMIALGSLTSPRWLSWLPERTIGWRFGPALEWLRPSGSLGAEAALVPIGVAAIAGLLALAGTVASTIAFMHEPLVGDIPFGNEAGLSAIVLAAGCLAAGLFVSGAKRAIGVIVAGLIIGIAAIFQVAPIWGVVLWAMLGGSAFVLAWIDERGARSYIIAGSVALTTVAIAAIAYAPPGRLTVSRFGPAPHPLFISEATLALGVLIAGLLVAGLLHQRARWARAALAAAGALVLYLVSVNIVDVFAGQAYGLGRLELARADELAKEAQVALSVLWTVTGVVIVGLGLALKQRILRLAGLAVLALATVKVFLVDLSSLDVAYRVVTLLVLGLLLIISAFVWTRMRPASGAGSDTPAAQEMPDDVSHAPHAGG